MPQRQPAWPRATLFVVMERETDWTPHVQKALVVSKGLCVCPWECEDNHLMGSWVFGFYFEIRSLFLFNMQYRNTG